MLIRHLGAMLLGLLMTQTACGGPVRATHATARQAQDGPGPDAHSYEVGVLEAGTTDVQPVEVSRQEFTRALTQLTKGLTSSRRPLEQAREVLGAPEETEVAFAVRVEDGHIVQVAPLPGPQQPTAADVALRREYLQLCEQQYGGGDCLDFLQDGPMLDEGDKQRLALAIALGAVLEETKQGLAEALDPKAALVSVLCMASLYLGLWLFPDPTTKAVAGVLTLGLLAWLGARTLWELVDGWETLAHEARTATTLEHLRQAGRKYGKVLGTHSARVLILLVTAAVGGTVSVLAKRLPLLPGFSRAAAQAEAQGGMRLSMAAEVETVAASSEGHIAVLMRGQVAQGGAAAVGPRPLVTFIKHWRGNRQVLSNGQRWHLRRNQPLSAIPKSDPVGDQLQQAATRIAGQWSTKLLTKAERDAIREMKAQGKFHRAHLLERQARGRFVQKTLEREFDYLHWNKKGVDAVDPSTGYSYEVLSGTEWNMALHGRRMHDVFFRMITF